MLKRLLPLLDRAPLFWVGVGAGLLVFAVNRVLPGISWETAPTGQSVLDQAFAFNLPAQNWRYYTLENSPQTFGAHVLPQYLRAALSPVTGDSGRAGIWLSLAGIVLTLCGLYPLAMRIFPQRGFGMITVLCAGALGALHFSLSPDPSTALGMALVVWGMVFFLTSITKRNPYDIFASGLLFGLAGYIRVELSMVWAVLAVYLIALSLFQSAKHKQGLSYFSMALGGLFTLFIVLWPMIHRNFGIAGTPILPGFDSEIILGAPSMSGQADPTAPEVRLLQGLKILMFHFRGPGTFVGLMWPVGMLICLLVTRHRRLPYFWLPVLISMLACLAGLSYVTGYESFEESLLILTPLLLPFAILPAAFALHSWMQAEARPAGLCQLSWLICGALLYLMIQLPHFLRPSSTENRELVDQRITLIEEYGALPPPQLNAMLLSDSPGIFLTAGKSNVLGSRGETDWQILTAKYANGEFQSDPLLAYLKAREVGMIHLSDVEDPLVDLLVMQAEAPEIVRVPGFSPPHRVYRVDWP